MKRSYRMIKENPGHFKKGCRPSNTIHGLSNTPLYDVWVSIKDRCLNKKNKQFKNYGGRGIQICEEWNDFMVFYNWALIGWEKGKEIHRLDNNKGYSPNNCVFITRSEHGKIPKANSKMSPVLVQAVRCAYAHFHPTRKHGLQRDIAKYCGVRVRVINNLVANRSWIL